MYNLLTPLTEYANLEYSRAFTKLTEHPSIRSKYIKN
jgi:hypothetical protein